MHLPGVCSLTGPLVGITHVRPGAHFFFTATSSLQSPPSCDSVKPGGRVVDDVVALVDGEGWGAAPDEGGGAFALPPPHAATMKRRTDGARRSKLIRASVAFLGGAKFSVER